MDSLQDDVLVSEKKIYRMQGINDQLVSTRGSAILTVIINDKTFETEFQVVDASFPITGDGILGTPFLKENNIIIDVNKGEITSTTNQESSIPARSEVIIPIQVDSQDSLEQQIILIHAQELSKNILCSNTINNVKKGQILISVINPTEEIQTMRTPKLSEVSHEIFDTISIYTIKSSEVSKNPHNRINLLREALRNDHMNMEEKNAIEELCSEFSDIFYLDGDKISCTSATLHEIKTPESAQPIFQRPYRLPYSQKTEIERQVKQLEQDNVITKSDSPWNAPLLVIPKKADATGEKKYRVVVDFRKLNNMTAGDAFPMPDVTTILDQLGKAKYFTCLDMASGYHQVPIHPRDKQKTAFSTDSGHYEFQRMCFGLKGAPATFQRLMNRVLQGINGFKAFVYLDDIVVISTTLDEHITQLREVFTRLRKYNLQLQPPKCEFLKHEVRYLGHIITEDGVKPDPEKISCVVNYRTPSNAKEVKSFLGLIGYYRRFVKDFSKIAKPLTNLLKKDEPYRWTDKCQEAFQLFKDILTNKPLLQYPDFSQPFNVTTDASNIAIGAILSQGEVGKDLPISYASRTLNKAEINYNTTEKELLSIIWATKQFRQYIYGRKFNIITDHKPLVWLFGVKDPGARLTRWRLQLEEFDYNIIYKPGTLNTNADALSRIAQINAQSNPKDYRARTYDTFVKDMQAMVISNSNVIEVQGDLFEAPADLALGHCVSKNFEMSRGIALEFKKKFGQVEALKQQNKNITEIAHIKHNERCLIYIITKEQCQQKPTLEILFKSIINLREFCETNNIEKIGLPRIGSGHDQLDWEEVRAIIRYIFKNSKIKVIIYANIEYSEEEKLKIIEEFHNTLLGGHQGVSKTIRRIKQHHQWKGLKADVKTYISTCRSCQLNKSSNRTIKQPMVITTTAKKPFEKVFLDVVGPLDTSQKGNRFILTMQDDLTKFSLAVPLPDHTANTIAKTFIEHLVCLHGIPQAVMTDQGTDFLSKIFTSCCKILQIEKIKTTAYHPQSNGALERSHRTLTEYLRHYTNERKQNWDEYLPYSMFVYNSSIHSTTGYQPYELLYGRPVEVPHSLSQSPQPCYNYDDYNMEMKQKFQESHEMARRNVIKQKEKSKRTYDQNQQDINVSIGDKVLIKNNSRKGKLSPKWKGPFIVSDVHSNENVSILRNNKKVKIHKNELKLFHD